MRFDPAWRVMLLALVMQTLVIGFGIYCFTFFVTPWTETFGAKRSELMLAYSLHSLTVAVLSPICGIWIDRYPARRLVTMGTLTFCVALCVIARAPSAIVIIVAYALVVPVGLLMAGPLMAQALVARAVRENQGRALGIAALGTSIGGFAMPPLITLLVAQMGWRDVFDLVALATAVAILPLVVFALRPGMEGEARDHHDEGARPTRELLREPAIFYLALAYLLPASALMAVMQNVGPLATDIGVSPQQASGVISITALLMAGGKIVVGTLADRVSLLPLYAVLAGSVAGGMLLASAADSLVPLAVSVFLVGTTAGGGFPLIAAAASRRFGPANFGRVLGIVMAVAGGSGLLPLAASWGRDLTGSYRAPFLVLAPTLALGMIAFVLFVRDERRAVAETAESDAGAIGTANRLPLRD